ncbi:alpha-N-acetylgalactosaminidase-like isoform X2 [Mya arenaria]|uniref:alpha-N-acetylgalactosaminidase-like isoform X2 n=1 Tax=Mya arenaria TaxID=6604 RepID=UPI0022E4834F|nr:alpha-N-acetylgalactosaminidase-like isoform X2 [Mya arenaria]
MDKPSRKTGARTVRFVLSLLLVAGVTVALENGLALTPPMGWVSWERYRCNVDCDIEPDNCISENLYMKMADLLVSEGYKDKGYEYVNIDDCWMEKQRDANGTLVADRERFPHGIKWLADYVHNLGLKLGIYEDFGTFTCGGYPGSKFYLQKDAETFAAWGVDMLKLDGCYSDISDMDYGYPAMSFFLNQTGRPILYSCSWPVPLVFTGHIPDYKKIASYCNIWRNYADIQDSWDSVKGIIEFYGNDTGNFSLVAGPGNFNDPDMIIVGDYGLSYDQQRTQMAMWAIMASPLLMSIDLRNVKPETKALLQNDNVIRVNQDAHGIQGHRIVKQGPFEVWMKPMSVDAKGGAFAFLNLNDGGGPMQVSMNLQDLGLTQAEGYNVTEGFTGQFIGVLKPHDLINASVDPSGVWFGIAYFDC